MAARVQRTFLVECDQRFREALPDCVRLRHVAAAFHTYTDVQLIVLVTAKQDDGLERLVPQDLILNELQRPACSSKQFSDIKSP